MTRRLSGIHAAWHFWFAVSFGGESGLRKLGLCGIHPLTRRYTNTGMKMEITVKKISKRSLFKMLFIGFSLSFFVFFLMCGIASIFGAETVKWEETPVTGVSGLLLALAMWPIFSFSLALFMWCFVAFGLWIYSLAKPLKLVFKLTAESN
ncbi:TPA: DUF3265 domain-containing protein [Vibrio vulnificus]|nr:DUF3265 domain-containing protein [Vibrio vulnificus]HDY7878530.1 DUF3265 domain-containing protein [Vibrio vulnificus]